MKFKRLFLTSITALCLLTSCSVAKNSGEDSNGRTKLNIAQSNLISEFTGNDKYINKNYLNKVNKLNDKDNVGVIVTLSDEGILDAYSRDTKGTADINEYVSKGYANKQMQIMSSEQGRIIDKMRSEGLIDEVTHNYSTLLNGFAVETTYGNYKKMKDMGIAKVSLQEVYSKPQATTVKSSGVTENVVDVYETGIFNSSAAAELGYTGSNTSVAILDSGFDVHHTVFQNMPEGELNITKDDVNNAIQTKNMFSTGYQPELKVEDVYLNAKIPYAYDYADKDEDVAPFESSHGTHVAGIIGGKDDVVTGVAVNTQLVLMKVFADVGSGAIDADIIAALEDSVKLGVDAINLSLGTACGFTTAYGKPELQKIYDKIRSKGISLIVAASNDYNSSYGGEQGNSPMATNPDSAAVGQPSTFKSSLAVASIAGAKSPYIKTADGYNFFFDEANGRGADNYDFYEMLGIKPGIETKIDYVTVPGVGKPVNYQAINVKNKIALVKRGGISFEEKAKYAFEAGAIGCILYNNVGGQILMNAGSDLEIAYCSISKDDGEALAKHKSGTLIFNTEFKAGPFMSPFSSWGPTPDLRLKPEITAHGGEILSSVPGGGYDKISGTSMASPNMCGIVVLIRQFLKEKFDLQDDALTLNKMTNQILMSTATIANDQYGNPYSPRKQGSGLGNLNNALKTKAYITVDELIDGKLVESDKTKLELGDDPNRTGEYILKFNIVNTANEKLTYKVGNKTMTEELQSADRRFIAERGKMLNPYSEFTVEGDGKKDGDNVVVDANGKVTITYKLKINDAEKKYMRQGFKNGIYVEGFATLQSLDGGVDLSVPFLAFFGDWTKAPMLDKTIFEVEAEKYNGSINEEDKLKADYYATQPLGRYFTDFIIPMGSYIYDMDVTKYNPIPTSEEHCALGYNDDNINGIMTIYAGLLRNARNVKSTITNTETGEVIYVHNNPGQLKAHFGGMQIPSFDMIEVLARDLKLENNVKYSFRMETELDYRDGGKNTNERNVFEFTFYCDMTKPIITNAEFYAKYDKSKKENRYYVDLSIYDNHYTQSIRPFGLVNGEVTILSEFPTPVYGGRDGISKVTVEVTDYMDLLQYNSSDSTSGNAPLTNGLGILVDDYALNQNFYFLTLPGTNATEIDFVDEDGKPLDSLTVYEGETLDVTKYIKTNDPLFNKDSVGALEFLSKMNYESSREEKFTVKNGMVYGVKSMNKPAYLTVSTVANDGMTYQKRIEVNVLRKAGRSLSSYETEEALNPPMLMANNRITIEDVRFTYFDTVKAFPDGPAYSKIGKTGDKVYVTNSPEINFYPSEQVKLHYDIKPYNIPDNRIEYIWQTSNSGVASVDENGLVTAESEGVATITLRVKVDGRMSNIMAKIKCVVNSEFIIQNRMLAGYKGKGGNVIIPEDKGILGIDPYAFSLYTLDPKIDVDENNPDGNKIPQVNDTIISVTIPSDIAELGKYAFYNCTALERVLFKSKPNGKKIDTCSIIKEHAFDGCKSLKDINLDLVTVIGEEAFRGCVNLKDIKLSKIYALGVRAFEGCTGLETIDITTLRNAGVEVFKNCTNLREVITGKYTKFSVSMFENCGLTSIDIYSDRIPAKTFKNCKNLASVNIKNKIIYIGQNAFEGTDALGHFNIENEADFIYKNAFLNSGITKITLPNSTFDLEEGAFLGCENLTTVVFQANTVIRNINSKVFMGTAVNNFVVPENGRYKFDNHILFMDNTSIVLATQEFNAKNFVVPEFITKIYDAAFNSVKGIETVTLHDNLYVGNYAFAACPNLTTVIGGKNASYGTGVFMDSTKLNSFEGLDKMEVISPYMFKNTGFSEITLNATTVSEGAFMGITTLKVVNGSIVNLGGMAFKNNENLLEYNATGTKVIGEFAFENCILLSKVNTESVVEVQTGGFMACKSIREINMPLAETLGDLAFANCSDLQIASFPLVTYVGDLAFSTSNKLTLQANKLENIELPKVEYIGNFAFFRNTKLSSFVTEGNITFLGAYAFADCTGLSNVSMINSKFDTIRENTFAGNIRLSSITINPVKNILDKAFYKNTNLSNINNLLSEVEFIGIDAFYGANNLTTLDMPKLKVVKASAFLDAKKVSSINMPQVEEIGALAFSNTSINNVKLPNTLTKVGPQAFSNNMNFEAFEALDSSKVADSEGKIFINGNVILHDGVLYTVLPNGKYLLSSYPTNKKSSTYDVIPGTLRVEFGAAEGNRNLTKVSLPDTLKLIGNKAFFECSMLNTVEFRSQIAPTLETTKLDDQINYPSNSEAYKLLYKYFPLSKPEELMYAQFIGFIGTTRKLDIIVPKLDVISGYDSVLYDLYFDYAGKKTSTYDKSRDATTLEFIDLINNLPKGDIKLSDEKAIVDTRTAYNKLKQDLKNFGYTDKMIESMLNDLKVAEDKIFELKKAKVYYEYGDLIEDIKNLGAYSYEKISEYKRLYEMFDLITVEERKYIDKEVLDIFDKFKKDYDDYFKHLYEDVEQIEEMVELPTTPVQLTTASYVSIASSVLAAINVVGLVLGKKFLI